MAADAIDGHANAMRLFSMFETMGIAYQNYPHKPVMTCADDLGVEIPAPHTKNLFLKDNKGGFWLVSTLENTRIEMKVLAKILQVKSLRFGKEEDLIHHLGVRPGSVTIFALINDDKNMVSPVIDELLLHNEVTCFHPLHNEVTTVIATKDLVRFIHSLGKDLKILSQKDLPTP